jgi:UDP-glucose 4-epimerase
MPIHTLVIGGGGYIGAHLVPKLLATGRSVTVIGRKKAPLYSLPSEAIYLTGDVSQGEQMTALLNSHEEIVHLAYATVPNTSFDDPLADLLQNLPSTVELLSRIAAIGGRLVLISSGGTVYGQAIQLPIREDHPTNPISPYGVTKLTLEKYAWLYAATHGLKVMCVRPSNAYGVGQRPHTGQGFVSTAIASALRGQAIKVYGRQGTVRDFIYVGDIAAGIVKVLERGRLLETYNLGSGVGRSTLDVIQAITPLLLNLDCKIRVEYLPERVFDVQANVLDSTKLQEHTGWKPEVEFLEGIARTLDWIKKLQ